VSSEVIAAILGALLAGGVQTILAYFDRRREDEAVLVAIASEVDALCRLLRHQNYLTDVHGLIEDLEAGRVTEATYVVDIRSDYLAVSHSLASQLGRLRPGNASLIVKFYAYCKTIVDGTRPDGVAAQAREKSDAIDALHSLVQVMSVTLAIGDMIVQLPKRPIVKIEYDR
jgi:hypothetical protein